MSAYDLRISDWSSDVCSSDLSFEGDPQCDVALIGGGFTGLSAALACAERGFSVILIEREHIGFGASGRNGGQLIPGLRWTASELETEFGSERAEALFDLCWRDNRVKARKIGRAHV